MLTKVFVIYSFPDSIESVDSAANNVLRTKLMNLAFEDLVSNSIIVGFDLKRLCFLLPFCFLVLVFILFPSVLVRF